MPTFASIKEMKAPSAGTVAEKVKGFLKKVWDGIQVIAFLIYAGTIDGVKKYVLTKDAIIVVLYSWIGIILRNAYFNQDYHNWSTKHSSLFAGKPVAPISTAIDSEVSPISLIPVLTSGRFAMIVLVVFNKLNRHDRGLVSSSSTSSEDENVSEPSLTNQITSRLHKLKYIAFDLLRCLLKDMVLKTILHGKLEIVFAQLYSDVKFVVITSLIVNHLVKVPSWYKR